MFVVHAGLFSRALPKSTMPPHRPRVGKGRSPGSDTSSDTEVKTIGRLGVPLALSLPPRQTKRQPKSLAALEAVPVPEAPCTTVPASMFRTALLIT